MKDFIPRTPEHLDPREPVNDHTAGLWWVPAVFGVAALACLGTAVALAMWVLP